MKSSNPAFNPTKHPYELSLTPNSEVVEVRESLSQDVPAVHYDYVQISDLTSTPDSEQVDVIGICSGNFNGTYKLKLINVDWKKLINNNSLYDFSCLVFTLSIIWLFVFIFFSVPASFAYNPSSIRHQDSNPRTIGCTLLSTRPWLLACIYIILSQYLLTILFLSSL